ncbi:DXImx40e protein [Aphelenchoides avenae]|nr:DXImx40e protein [Aphelenchus avenae]
MATVIASAIKNLGIREEFAYHTLLYHNIFEVRRIFISLIEKLPKESVFQEVTLSPLERLQRTAGASISRHLKEPWVPEFCRYLKMKYDGRLWHPNKPKPRMATNKPKESYAEQSDDGILLKAREEHKQAEVTKQIEDMASTVAFKESHVEMMKKETIEFRYAQVRLEDEIGRLKDLFDSRDQRLLQAMEDPEAAEQKLRGHSEAARERRSELEERFLEAKADRSSKIEKLRHELGQTLSADSLRSQTVELKKEIEKCTESMESKQRIRVKLEKELAKISASPKESRTNFVKRIMEIVQNVNKQKEDIRKTVASIRKLEHEIDSLNGKLDRTFTAVDRWLGKQAEVDQRMQKAYKTLVRFYEQCALVKTALEERGQINRIIDELTDEIEIESQKSVDAQLERLLSDLMMIRQENAELLKRLSQPT